MQFAKRAKGGWIAFTYRSAYSFVNSGAPQTDVEKRWSHVYRPWNELSEALSYLAGFKIFNPLITIGSISLYTFTERMPFDCNGTRGMVQPESDLPPVSATLPSSL